MKQHYYWEEITSKIIEGLDTELTYTIEYKNGFIDKCQKKTIKNDFNSYDIRHNKILLPVVPVKEITDQQLNDEALKYSLNGLFPMSSDKAIARASFINACNWYSSQLTSPPVSQNKEECTANNCNYNNKNECEYKNCKFYTSSSPVSQNKEGESSLITNQFVPVAVNNVYTPTVVSDNKPITLPVSQISHTIIKVVSAAEPTCNKNGTGSYCSKCGSTENCINTQQPVSQNKELSELIAAVKEYREACTILGKAEKLNALNAAIKNAENAFPSPVSDGGEVKKGQGCTSATATLVLTDAAANETFKFLDNGDVFVKGKFITNDIEIVNALKEFVLNKK